MRASEFENFADGKKPGRKGLAKRSGVNCKQSVTKLRKIASNSRAKVTGCRPEARRSTHGQGEAWVTLRGGPNSPRLKTWGMTCGWG